MKTGLKSIAAAAIAAFTFGFTPSAMASDPNEEGVQLWEDGPYWATCNVGASDPMEEGYFYWWGDTKGYVFVNNQWNSVDGTIKDFNFSKDNEAILTIGMDRDALFQAGYINADGTLKPEYDPATRLLGEPWRMPTQAEIEKLVEKCTYIKVNPSATYQRFSYKFQGKGDFVGKSILFCGSGSAVGKTHTITTTTAATIWSSTSSVGAGSDSSWYLSMPSQGSASSSAYNRYTGYVIRAVRTKPLVSKYDITIATGIQHGTVTSDKEKAEKGDTVTLTVTPDAGYETAELKYFKTEDPTTEVTISGNTFTMPAYSVTVTATFELIKYDVTIDSGIQHGTVTADKARAAEGDKVTLTVTPASEYERGSLIVYKTGEPGTTVTVTDDTFTMPAYPVTVTATFEVMKYDVTIDGTIQHGTVATDKARAAKNETVTLTVTPDVDYELNVDSLRVELTVTGGKPITPTPGATAGEYFFTMPGENVIVAALFRKIEKETLQLTDASGNPIDVTLNYTWVKNLTGKTKASEQAAALNVKQNNQQMLWQNAILGLTGSDPTSIPVIAPIQLSDPGYVGFRLSGVNVDTASGASVSNKVWKGATPGAHTTSYGPYLYTEQVNVPVPESGVQYYDIEVLIK